MTHQLCEWSEDPFDGVEDDRCTKVARVAVRARGWGAEAAFCEAHGERAVAALRRNGRAPEVRRLDCNPEEAVDDA